MYLIPHRIRASAWNVAPGGGVVLLNPVPLRLLTSIRPLERRRQTPLRWNDLPHMSEKARVLDKANELLMNPDLA